MLISVLTNIVTPSLTDNSVFYGGNLSDTRFPTIREYINFSFNVEILNSVLDAIITNPPILTAVIVDSVILNSYNPSITITRLSNSKFTISGLVTNVFTDRFYKFRMLDDTIQTIDPNKNQNAYGVVQYQADLRRYIDLTYTFNVNTQQLVRYQTVNNNWETQRLIFKQKVLEGK